jgi:RNA polymerase sigma-70 factor (ECF subfamily)
MTLFQVAIDMDQDFDHLLDSEETSSSSTMRFSGPPLLPLIANGHASAVDQFVDRYGGLIWSIVRKSTRGSHDAEDMVQDIFIDLWKNAASFQSERGTEVAFVALIARRRVIDRIRKRSAIPPLESLADRPIYTVFDGDQDSLEIADEVGKIRNCLAQLSANTRGVLVRVLQEGMSHQEISSAMDLPLGSVKSYARRGLLFVRECVKRPLASPTQEVQS